MALMNAAGVMMNTAGLIRSAGRIKVEPFADTITFIHQ